MPRHTLHLLCLDFREVTIPFFFFKKKKVFCQHICVSVASPVTGWSAGWSQHRSGRTSSGSWEVNGHRARLSQTRGMLRALAWNARGATSSPNVRSFPQKLKPAEKTRDEAYFALSCHLAWPSSEPKMLILHFMAGDRSAADAKILTSYEQQPSSQKV